MNKTSPSSENSPARLWLTIFAVALAAGGLWLAVFGGSTWQPSPSTGDESSPEHDIASAVPPGSASDSGSGSFRERLGIEVTSANLSVGGSRVNVRYMVKDADRAILLTNKLNSALLLDSDGKPLVVTSSQILPMQNQSGHKPRAGYIYSYFFPNPNGVVKRADQVTLVIGDLRQRLLVQ